MPGTPAWKAVGGKRRLDAGAVQPDTTDGRDRGTRMDISPDKQNIDRVFSNTAYYIDFYQRDYRWTAEPVLRLLAGALDDYPD